MTLPKNEFVGGWWLLAHQRGQEGRQSVGRLRRLEGTAVVSTPLAPLGRPQDRSGSP
ncbi:MAG: hypothetical protein ACHBN1_16895 [Heteroscytonema crispum UTEX LB 1556]